MKENDKRDVREYTAEQEKVTREQASKAYDSIDRYLRNNMDDDDYADYSAELDKVYAYAATLRQQSEPAQAVSDEAVEAAFVAMDAVFSGAFPDARNGEGHLSAEDKAIACRGVRAALEAVAPLLQSHPERAKVPDEMTQQVFREDDPERFGYVRGFNACRDLVLAAAPSQPAQVVDMARKLIAIVEKQCGGYLSGLGYDALMAAKALDRALSGEKAGPADGWQPIETAPKGKPVLVHYTNELGKGRTIKAYYVERFTEESSPDSENDEYNEADDTYYTLPGWYEMIDNWDEYSSVFVHHDPIHWMPIPASPTPGKEE